MEADANRREADRRHDDYHGAFSHPWVRKILSAFGVVLMAIATYFWREKERKSAQLDATSRAVETNRNENALEIAALKQEVRELRQMVYEWHSEALRVEDKVDSVLMGMGKVERNARRISQRQIAALRPDITQVLVCRDGWDIWVPAIDAAEFVRRYRGATVGACH